MSKEIDYIGGFQELLRSFGFISFDNKKYKFWKNNYSICIKVIQEEIYKLEKDDLKTLYFSLEQIAMNLERLKEENLRLHFMSEDEVGYFNIMCEIINVLYENDVIIEVINGEESKENNSVA